MSPLCSEPFCVRSKNNANQYYRKRRFWILQQLKVKTFRNPCHSMHSLPLLLKKFQKKFSRSELVFHLILVAFSIENDHLILGKIVMTFTKAEKLVFTTPAKIDVCSDYYTEKISQHICEACSQRIPQERTFPHPQGNQ